MYGGDRQVGHVWVVFPLVFPLCWLREEETVILVISGVIIPLLCLLPPSLGKH